MTDAEIAGYMNWRGPGAYTQHHMNRIRRIVEEVQRREREAISDEWSSRMQSDLEHGVKSLNEKATKDWQAVYPAMAGFGEWLHEGGRA